MFIRIFENQCLQRLSIIKLRFRMIHASVRGTIARICVTCLTSYNSSHYRVLYINIKYWYLHTEQEYENIVHMSDYLYLYYWILSIIRKNKDVILYPSSPYMVTRDWKPCNKLSEIGYLEIFKYLYSCHFVCDLINKYCEILV